MRAAVTAVLLAACAAPGVAGRTFARQGAPPGAYVEGAVAGLAPLAVLDRRDFAWAVDVSAAPAAVAWTHLSDKGFLLGQWALEPEPMALGHALLNEQRFDVEAVAFSPDGRQVAAASRDGTLSLFARGSAEAEASAGLGEPLTAVAWSNDGGFVAVGGEKGLVALVRAPGLEVVHRSRPHTDEVRALGFEGGGRLFSGSWDRTVATFRIAAPETSPALEEIRRHRFPLFVNDLTVDRAGRLLGVAFGEAKAERSYDVYRREKDGVEEPVREDNCGAIVDASTGAIVRRLAVHRGTVATAAISPDGTALATGGWDRELLLFGAASDRPVARARFGWSVRRARFSPDGRFLAVAAWTPQSASPDRDSDPSLVVYDVLYRAGARPAP